MELELTPHEFYMLINACAHAGAAHEGSDEFAEYANLCQSLIGSAEAALKAEHTTFSVTSR